MSIFDDWFDTGSSLSKPIKPLWTVKKEDAGEWSSNAFRSILKWNEEDLNEVRENITLYNGRWIDSVTKSQANQRTTAQTLEPQMARNSKLYVNKLAVETDWRCNKLTQIKPAIEVNPANTEYDDRTAAKVAKSVLDSLWYELDIDALDRKSQKFSSLAGEHYIGVLWNPEKGDLHPDYVKEAAENTEMGLKVKGPIRKGDVEYVHYPRWKTLRQPGKDWPNAEFVGTWDTMDLDEAKKKYPKQAAKIDFISGQIDGFTDEYLKCLKRDNQTIIVTWYNKRCDNCPEGRWLVTTADGVVLIDKDLPYQHDSLPLVMLTDIDDPDSSRAYSFYRNLRALQYQHYYLTSLVVQNTKLFCNPKWVYNEGSINTKNLTNASTLIGVKGPKDPRILQPAATPTEVFKQIADIENQIQLQVRGPFSNPETMPKRTDSFLAFQFLFEQDYQRLSESIAKRNTFLVQLAKLTLQVVGEYYDVQDDRIIKIIGKNQEHDIKSFDLANFNRPYDIRIVSGNPAADTKSSRIATLVEVAERIPNVVPPDVLVDALDLGSSQKVFDYVTRARRAAESIIQDLLAGKAVPDPVGYENLMTYWEVFFNSMQDRNFKESVPEDRRINIEDYMGAIEMLMIEKGVQNPAFAAQIQGLPMFPVIFVPPPPAPPPGMEMMAAAPQTEIAPEDMAGAEEAYTLASQIGESVGAEPDDIL